MNFDAFSQVCPAADFSALGLAVTDFPLPGFGDIFKLDTSAAASQENWVTNGSPLSIFAGAPSYQPSYAQTDQTNKFSMPSVAAQSFTMIVVAGSPVKGAGNSGTFLWGNFSGAGETAAVFVTHTGTTLLRLGVNAGTLDVTALNQNPADLSFFGVSVGPTSSILAEGYNGVFRASTLTTARAAGSVNPLALGSSYSTTFGAGDRSLRLALAAQKNGTAHTAAELFTAYKALRDGFSALGVATL